MMKKWFSLLLCMVMMAAVLGCAAEDRPLSVTGHVTEIDKYGHAVLDVTVDGFAGAGFELGDVITVSAGMFTGDLPYFNGFYVDSSEYMIRAYPGNTNIDLCINYGRFAETAGIGVGDEVTLTLKEKAGALSTQEINNLVYSDDRADFESDVVFANFRAVRLGKSGKAGCTAPRLPWITNTAGPRLPTPWPRRPASGP